MLYQLSYSRGLQRTLLTVCAFAMTVRTYDIALRDLIEQSHHADSTCYPRDLELLCARIPMIEVHHVGGVPLAAVDARNLSKQSYECDLFRHGFPRSSEELLAMRFVEPPAIRLSVSIPTTIATHPHI
jgi:hypothetical protein